MALSLVTGAFAPIGACVALTCCFSLSFMALHDSFSFHITYIGLFLASAFDSH